MTDASVIRMNRQSPKPKNISREHLRAAIAIIEEYIRQLEERAETRRKGNWRKKK